MKLPAEMQRACAYWEQRTWQLALHQHGWKPLAQQRYHEADRRDYELMRSLQAQLRGEQS